MLDFKTLWNQALPFHDYLAAATRNQELWEGIYRLARIPQWAMKVVPEGEKRQLLVLAEDWCGDASNTVPVMARWSELAPGMDLRVLRRDEHPAVMDQYLTNGSRSIPIAIVLDQDFREVGHWGPRPSELQAFVMENLGKVPKAELYPQTRRWYARDHGETTLREIMAVIGPR